MIETLLGMIAYLPKGSLKQIIGFIALTRRPDTGSSRRTQVYSPREPSRQSRSCWTPREGEISWARRRGHSNDGWVRASIGLTSYHPDRVYIEHSCGDLCMVACRPTSDLSPSLFWPFKPKWTAPHACQVSSFLPYLGIALFLRDRDVAFHPSSAISGRCVGSLYRRRPQVGGAPTG